MGTIQVAAGERRDTSTPVGFTHSPGSEPVWGSWWQHRVRAGTAGGNGHSHRSQHNCREAADAGVGAAGEGKKDITYASGAAAIPMHAVHCIIQHDTSVPQPTSTAYRSTPAQGRSTGLQQYQDILKPTAATMPNIPDPTVITSCMLRELESLAIVH